jgi:hypothetical protein
LPLTFRERITRPALRLASRSRQTFVNYPRRVSTLIPHMCGGFGCARWGR